MNEKMMEVRNLKKYFSSRSVLFSGKKQTVKAVDGISLIVKKGSILGIVGESGCGKSTLGRTVIRLLEATSGEVLFEGINLKNLGREEMRKKRKDLQIIFQDPGASLNPRMTIGMLIQEPIDLFFRNLDEDQRKQEVHGLMDMVGLNRGYFNRFPHEFSGGQRQRIGIARALATQPKLVVCDEPVSALDVSVRAQILNLIKDMKKQFALTYLFISHDLSVVYHICDTIAVMYLGRIVEISGKELLYANPMHPYTQALLSANPVPDPLAHRKRIILPGDVPSPANPPPGCHFHPRCPFVMPECKIVVPELVEVSIGHHVACHLTRKMLDRKE